MVSGRLHTLHAIYHTNCLPHIENLIERGDHKITHFFGEAKVKYLTENDIRPFDPDLLSLLNVNSPQDFEKLKAKLAKRTG